MTRRFFFRAVALVPAALLVAPRSASATMDTAKMQAVAAAITNAGYDADIKKQQDGTWTVRARSAQMDIPISAAGSLAAAQSVSAFAADIVFT